MTLFTHWDDVNVDDILRRILLQFHVWPIHINHLEYTLHVDTLVS